MRRILAALVMAAVLAGCREVRVNQQRAAGKSSSFATGGRSTRWAWAGRSISGMSSPSCC
jgi:uncharacterized protein YceK